MSIPRYSIITVCLNAKEALAITLHSIEQQTFKNFEWIIIDGKSADGTIDIVQDHHCVTHLVSESDKGIYDAMNKGVNLANGEYLLFLNAGDWLYCNNTLQNVDSRLDNQLVVGDIAVVKDKKTYIKEYGKFGINKRYCYTKSFPHQSTFIKKCLFDKYGYYCEEFKIRGDHDLFARFMMKNVPFSFLNFCISVFPLNGISFQMKKSKLLHDELLLVRTRNFSIIYRVKMKIYDFFDCVFIRHNEDRNSKIG